MTARQQELRRRHAADVCDTIRRYILDGHEFTLMTEHGTDEGAPRVTFALRDWESFVAMLEAREGVHGRASA